MATEGNVQRTTLDKFLAAWKNWSAADMIATWSDNCTQMALPFSMGHQVRSRSEVQATLPLLQQAVTEYKVSTQSILRQSQLFEKQGQRNYRAS